MPTTSGSTGSLKNCTAAIDRGDSSIAAIAQPPGRRPRMNSAADIGAKTTAARSPIERKPRSLSILPGIVSAATAAAQRMPAIVRRDAPSSAPGSRDNAVGVLEWEAGAVGIVRSCDRCRANAFGRRLRVSGTNGSAEIAPIERFDGKELVLDLNLCEAAGGLPKGRQTLRFGPQGRNGNVDRYIGQLRQFARIVRGEEKEPDGLCEHDLAVQRTILRMIGLPLSAAAGR